MKSKVEVKINTKQASRVIRRRLVTGLRTAASYVDQVAQQEIPVDQGTLKAHTRVEVDDQALEIDLKSGGKGARHAHLVEYGTVKTPPNPYMRRTKAKTKQPVFRILGEAQKG